MNIAITGLNSTDNPGPGVPVIRSIRAEKNLKGASSGLFMILSSREFILMI